MKMDIKYTTADKQFVYSGNIASHGLTLSGIEAIDRISDIKGNFNFNNSVSLPAISRPRSWDYPSKGNLR